MQSMSSSIRKKNEKKTKKTRNFQDRFLNSLRGDDVKVKVETTTSKIYVGKLISFDQNVVILETEEGQVMLYKRALCSVGKV